MNKVVQVDGGIGRVISATGALERMSEPPIVVTSWPDVFEFNSKIDKQYPMNHVWLYDDVVRGREFICPEPYYDLAYRNQECHISQFFNRVLNNDDSLVYPSISLLESERHWARSFVDNIRKTTMKDRVVAYQPFGAGMNEGTDASHRSLSLEAARFIAGKIDGVCVNCTTGNLDHPNVWHKSFSLRELIAIISECDCVLSVDSCVHHIGAAFRKPGMVLCGSTYPRNIGWPHYIHVSRNRFPKSYMANRFSGFRDLNDGAMSFTDSQLEEIVALFNSDNIYKQLEGGGADYLLHQV